MKVSFVPAAWLAMALLAGNATNAGAAPLSLFQYEELAQQHCPNDTVVWLDLKKRIYYLKGQRLYAQGNTGTFVCRAAARTSGYRRSLLGRR
jgi:hypothetical protein